jgi:hypothetical protein
VHFDSSLASNITSRYLDYREKLMV